MPRIVVASLVVALVLALAGVGTWYFKSRNLRGYVQLTATPWGEVTGVNTAKGEHLNVTGQTPLQLSLPPGRYVIELKNGSTTGKVEVSVERGKVSAVTYTFPAVKINDLVQKIVSQY
jgi:ferric-dicitrate binding protein FerR (iron transport regulator)